MSRWMMPFWCVLDGLADRQQQFQPLAERQLVLVAVLSDWYPLDQFHDEIGAAGIGRAGVDHLGDVGMIH